jgi:hypothetical protein
MNIRGKRQKWVKINYEGKKSICCVHVVFMTRRPRSQGCLKSAFLLLPGDRGSRL